MGAKIHTAIIGLTVAAITLVMAPSADAAQSTKPTVRPPFPSATISAPQGEVFEDANAAAVTVSGLTRVTPVTIVWGDGTQENLLGSCTAKQARKFATRCSKTIQHGYTTQPDHRLNIQVIYRGSLVAGSDVWWKMQGATWTKPSGWAQPSGWSLMNSRATFPACSTVYWYYDRAGEPGSSSTIHDDIAGGLGSLSAETGLAFTETTDPNQANIRYDWKDLSVEYPDAEGVGGGQEGSGEVTFATNGNWVNNEWAGMNFVTKQWDEGNLRYTWTLPGRAWLVIHETMHVLGFGHVDDATQVMNPVSSVATYGQGDLDGLHTLYKNMPCAIAS